MAVNSDVFHVCLHLGEIDTFRKHDVYKRQYKMGKQYKYVTNASAQLRDTRITVCARNMVISVMEFQAWGIQTIYFWAKDEPTQGKILCFFKM